MASVTVSTEKGILRRPMATTGWWSWFTTVDHKKIGILYGVSSFLFFVLGGLEALLIRSQLAKPGNTLLNAEQYNQIFTMHALTMIFLFVMPMSAAFFNYLIPLMIGARDVAFPRLNALSFWVFLLGALFLNSSWFLGGAPDGGWFAYPPNSVTDPGNGMTFYAIGLLITGIASTIGAINLAITVLNMRAPGMSMFRMPVFVWMGLVVQFLLAFSLPIITVALFQLLFDRRWDTAFFDPTRGGEPILWQHMFWLFGHPEVYILILPAFGIISEILPVFSRKPLFGYQFVVFSGIAIGFIGFGVWAHHMFAAGLGPVANTAFGITTAIIAIPTGVKIFNWMGTMYGGDLKFDYADAVRGRRGGDVRDRRALRRHARDRALGLPADRHVLHRGALPLRAVRRRDLRAVRRHVLLVAEGVRPHAQRTLGQGPLLDHAASGSTSRSGRCTSSAWRHDPPRVHLPGVARAHVLEPGRVGRRVPDRAVRADVHHERGAHAAAAGGARGRGPVGRAHARVDDLVAAARVQLRRDPARARARRVLAPQVRRGQGGPARARARGRLRRGRTPPTGGHGIHLPSPSFWPLVVSLGLPAHGLRRAVFLVAGRGRRGRDAASALSAGRSSPRWRSRRWSDIDAPAAGTRSETSTGLSSTKLAMWLFLSSECLLFGGLITTYLLYRGAEPDRAPYPQDVFDIGYTSVSSFVLLASSLTMVLALNAAHDKDYGRMRLWLPAPRCSG